MSTAHAAPMGWSNFYVSVFGGAAAGNGSVSASGEQFSYYDPENCTFGSPYTDPEYCVDTLYNMIGSVGSGFLGGAAIGTTIGPNTRAELETSFGNFGTTTNWTQTGTYDPEATFFDPENPGFTNTGSSKDSLTAMFVFGNIWYDIPLGNQLSAYVGGGAGFAHASGQFSAAIAPPGEYPTSNLSLTVNGFAPAVQVGAGLTFAVAPKVTLDLGYRFKEAFGLPVTESSTFDQSLFNVTHSTSMNLGVHVFQVGVNFALN